MVGDDVVERMAEAILPLRWNHSVNNQDLLRAALSALGPEYVLVPREPTDGFVLENINDMVSAELTESGARILNEKHKRLNERFPKFQHAWKTDHRAGDVVKCQFWALVGDFDGEFAAGRTAPFTNLRAAAPSLPHEDAGDE